MIGVSILLLVGGAFCWGCIMGVSSRGEGLKLD